jgi:hypothetical protein
MAIAGFTARLEQSLAPSILSPYNAGQNKIVPLHRLGARLVPFQLSLSLALSPFSISQAYMLNPSEISINIY